MLDKVENDLRSHEVTLQFESPLSKLCNLIYIAKFHKFIV